MIIALEVGGTGQDHHFHLGTSRQQLIYGSLVVEHGGATAVLAVVGDEIHALVESGVDTERRSDTVLAHGVARRDEITTLTLRGNGFGAAATAVTTWPLPQIIGGLRFACLIVNDTCVSKS
jgi:hypothetical protein